ncbi:MAG: orotate phosphoribosyltransferase [Bacteroidia bacterium]
MLKIKAVKLRTDPPFTWSSGWRSPIYCDNRLTLSYPEIRQAIRDAFVAQIRAMYPQADGIAGVATGAIAQGMLVAEALGLPFIYIRPAPKGHGMENLVEGDVSCAASYVVVEDLISTGRSSVQAVQALQATGVQVLGTVAIFSYGFAEAGAAFARTGTSYYSLTNLAELLEKAIELAYLQSHEQQTILDWQQSPATWGV